MIVPGARAAAYALLDEAVRARHEGRAVGAMNSITQARRLDADLPGIDFFVGEMAWESGDGGTVRRAAGESLRRGHNLSGSRLLLALVNWSTRSGSEAAVVGESVREMLAEVAAESPSDPSAFFFHGELSRMLGDGAAAHRQLLGALHRQVPWASASLLSAKTQLAAAEASRLARPAPAPPPDEASQAVLALLGGADDPADRRVLLGNVIKRAPLPHFAFLLEDPALTGWSGVDGFLPIDRSRMGAAIPHSAFR